MDYTHLDVYIRAAPEFKGLFSLALEKGNIISMLHSHNLHTSEIGTRLKKEPELMFRFSGPPRVTNMTPKMVKPGVVTGGHCNVLAMVIHEGSDEYDAMAKHYRHSGKGTAGLHAAVAAMPAVGKERLLGRMLMSVQAIKLGDHENLMCLTPKL